MRQGAISQTDLEKLTPPRRVLQAIILFSEAFNSYTKASRRGMQQEEITNSQFVCLWVLLLSSRSLQPSEISRLLPIGASSVSSLLEKLAKRKLIRRRRTQNDRRAVEVSLTEQGRQLIERLVPVMREWVINIFKNLSEQELDTFLYSLEKIRDASMRALGIDEPRSEDYWKNLIDQLDIY